VSLKLIKPDWPLSSNVKAVSSLRTGGHSLPPFAELNLGDHVGDELSCVVQNRSLLAKELGLLEPLSFLEQVHGTKVELLNEPLNQAVPADAAVTFQEKLPCVVMTADCLPVLFCDKNETVVAAAHAGWRGLLDGVLENTVLAMKTEPQQIFAWLGPAIGPSAFEVGPEVWQLFVDKDSQTESAFTAVGNKYLADIYQLARRRLSLVGVTAVFGGDHCTYSEPEQFFSYRREGQTGRMASLIWLES